MNGRSGRAASQRVSHRGRERGARRRRILEAAEAVFSAREYHDASITEIAMRAELATGTIYLYFGDKADLYGNVILEKMNDVVGRVKTYEAIVKGEDIFQPGVPESFKVLVKELQSLGLAVEVLNEEEEEVTFAEDVDGADVRSLDINISGFDRGEID